MPKRAPFSTPTAQDVQTAAAQRAFESFTRTISRETSKANKLDLERRRAMANALPLLIDNLEEDALTVLFFGLEANATASDRKKIATHPQRPEAVDDLHAEVNAEQEAVGAETSARDAPEASSAKNHADRESAEPDTQSSPQVEADPFEQP